MSARTRLHSLLVLNLLHRRLSRKFNFSGRMRDINIEIPGSNRPLVILNVVIGEGSAIQRDLNMLALPRTELHFCESLQFLYRTRNRGMPVANINLRNVGSGT